MERYSVSLRCCTFCINIPQYVNTLMNAHLYTGKPIKHFTVYEHFGYKNDYFNNLAVLTGRGLGTADSNSGWLCTSLLVVLHEICNILIKKYAALPLWFLFISWLWCQMFCSLFNTMKNAQSIMSKKLTPYVFFLPFYKIGSSNLLKGVLLRGNMSFCLG